MMYLRGLTMVFIVLIATLSACRTDEPISTGSERIERPWLKPNPPGPCGSPVVPGGMTQGAINDSIAAGWDLGFTLIDVTNARVMFKDSFGQLYWACGTVPSGTTVLRAPDSSWGLTTNCGNQNWVETIGNSWFP
jgi:hypothetical protein